MLTTARPIFEHVPGSFCDPVGLADQQAQGVVALVVVRYPTTDDPAPTDDHREKESSPPDYRGSTREPKAGASQPGEAVLEASTAQSASPPTLGPTYDAFVAVSGQLLTVARSTPDYRFPVMPAAALARFFEHRDAGRPTFLSLYELTEVDCARFLETVFYAECLKLHVDGTDSAALVAQQITRSGCFDGLPSGLLEVNDFSDPSAPRLHLVDLDALPHPPGSDVLPDALRPHLDGVTGRVLLYDRAKNRAVAPDRNGRAFDLDAAIEQAGRMALARRGSTSEAVGAGDDAARALHRSTAALRASAATVAEDDQAEAVTEAVESYLRDRADRPRLVEPDHPHASGLGALVAELQGRTTTAGPSMTDPPSTQSEASLPLGPALPADSAAPSHATAPTPVEQSINGNSPPTLPLAEGGGALCRSGERAGTLGAAGRGSQGGVPAGGGGPSSPSHPSSPSTPPPYPGPAPVHRHPLATELDRLRCDVYALFEEAVSKDRAAAHEAHVLAEHGLPHPVPAERTPAYLRALLTDDPPRRWHFFKRQRGKTYEEVAGKLLAFHAAHGHSDDPDALRALHEVTKLWTRLHK